MRVRVMAALLCAGAIGSSIAANADDAAAPSPPQASPSPTPALLSQARVFLISPEESQQAFMCESGRIESVLATAIAEHRIVSLTLLDASKNPIPAGVWTSAYGFKLTHKQNLIISVMMICGQ